MKNDTPNPIRLIDYTPYPFTLHQVRLHFDLRETGTRVTSEIDLERKPDAPPDAPLVLDGISLTLLHLSIDGRPLDPALLRAEGERFRLDDLPDRFTLRTVVRIEPQENTTLLGLYKSGGLFCTQCEAEGFRRITYYPDRPDVMSRFHVTIEADRALYPVLLANGNPVGRRELPDGRHEATWEDPFKKPSYLFALVAGNLGHIEDAFTTASGRTVTLRLYAQGKNAGRLAHAMESLKRAMRWDETAFGREYDLDLFMIVAVDDFNFGAMENKGLNIFNAGLLVAIDETATDADYDRIESVVAHEYFHNWSGDRVTLRDWFQLSLKEGFTVFRDEEFSADMIHPAVKRIEDVRVLRTHQFREDAGPLAHPVRPDQYIEIGNFYTATVYNKGAEVIRMMKRILGPDAFRRGCDLYFARHDGQAVRVEEFVAAMEEAGGLSLTPFMTWYTQAGTPEVAVEMIYHEAEQAADLLLRQTCPPTPGQPTKEPFVIPVEVGLMDPSGEGRPLTPLTERKTFTILLDAPEKKVRFTGLPRRPIPSLLRGFSAPVKLRYDYGDEELAFLLSHDEDDFNRWEAGQILGSRVILRLAQAVREGAPLQPDDRLTGAFRQVIENDRINHRLAAEALLLPDEAYLAEMMEVYVPDALAAARAFVRDRIAVELAEPFRKLFDQHRSIDDRAHDNETIGRRRLKNVALAYLVRSGRPEMLDLCWSQMTGAGNMTDELTAFSLLCDVENPRRDEAIRRFFDRWQDELLVIDKWFAAQAVSSLPDCLPRVRALREHPQFNLTNPNRVRALFRSFAQNLPHFHNAEGSGYAFIADQVIALNGLNPVAAASLCRTLSGVKTLEPGRRGKLKLELERILSAPGLSKDVFEIASKSHSGLSA